MGVAQYLSDVRTGRFARRVAERVSPDCCYAFTQVGLELLRWARTRGVPAVVESPNGHIAGFRDVYAGEASRWECGAYRGHPNGSMVRRVTAEYSAASHVRVSSAWARASLEARGVPAARITVLQQTVDVTSFPAQPFDPGAATGPLRLCFVGSLDLRKGFLYLLRAARLLGAQVVVEFVGGTGDRCCRQLLERERAGLAVTVAPGDPRPALARSELFVLPTLEDGSPFAVAEAMASARAIVTTTATGAAEWVRSGETGWVVRPGSPEALADAFRAALDRRIELPAMGLQARRDTLDRVAGAGASFASWVMSL